MEKNLWPEFENFAKIQTPQQILEEQGKKLSEATQGLVYGSVRKSHKSADSEIEALPSFLIDQYDKYDFNFRFMLASKYLLGYEFQMFIISHNIDIFPLKLKLDIPTAKEIGVPEVININDDMAFTELLSQIFKSQRVTKIVYNIMQLAKPNIDKETNDRHPF